MARRVSWGTPFKSLHYLFPRGKGRFLVPSLLAGGALLVLLLVAHFAGWRRPVAPGAVISAHATFEGRCQECHRTRHGASNARCQRCHDAAGAGRLTQSAHAFFGSADPKVAAAQPNLECARCHVEHRGRGASLEAVDQTQCASCHFRGFSGHPEFAVLRRPSREVPGVLFTHDRHVKEKLKETGGAEKDTCVTCHEPQTAAQPGRTPDIEPIAFDKHCKSCHVKDDSIGIIDPITLEDVLGPEQLEGLGLGSFDPGEFEVTRGRISKVAVAHQDEWVLTNLRKLRREIDPTGYAAERGALLARKNQLERRLVQAFPLAGEDEEALRARAAAVESETKGLEARLVAQAGAASPAQGLARVQDVAAAAAAAGDAAAADPLKAKAAELTSAGLVPAALPAGDHEARRQELLAALEAVQSVDPELKPRADDLRRRLAALRPGDTGTEALTRALDQRKADLARLKDEIALRESGTAPPATSLLAAEQRATRDAMRLVRARLQLLAAAPEPKANVTPEELERKKQSVEVLTAPCVKCHVVKDAAFTRVVPAGRVLVRSTFAHDPHLKQADCARCHAGVEKSKLSSDLNFKGVESCRECHTPRETRETCATCHRYHPPVAP
jgi:Cytochrome c3/Cytochrome c7 and related cytochrome c